jgi:GTP pyrophosphokinase
MANADDIIVLMEDHKPNKEETILIEKACVFAEKAHEGQLRASGDPYFTHVLATAKNLASFGMDATTIAAGLLHDTIEDGKATEEEIQTEFGDDILFLVQGVTKLGKVKYQGRERHAESLRKFFVAVAADFRVLMIKLADRLHNLQTLQYVKPEKQKRIALEAIEIYAPLAHRLGIGKLKGDIEDAAFPFAFPKEYAEIEKFMKQKKEATETNIKAVEIELGKELEQQKVTVVKMNSRIKHKYSLWKKLQKYKKEPEKIYDIMALRVIVPTIEDCYRTLGIVHSLWRPLPERIKDYIALPKLNGYQSLHTTIFTGDGGIVEIQIRTPEMHGIAEYGIASHFAYKEVEEKNKKPKTVSKYAWIDEFHELARTIHENDAFLKDLKMDFFKDRIFIFTPEGDVIDLPEESSPIDFAYAIHSDIGNHTSSAKINGKMSPLSTKLQMNDIVEIHTKESAHPGSKWLDYAKTTLARKHIKAYVDEHSLLNKYIFNRFK